MENRAVKSNHLPTLFPIATSVLMITCTGFHNAGADGGKAAGILCARKKEQADIYVLGCSPLTILLLKSSTANTTLTAHGIVYPCLLLSLTFKLKGTAHKCRITYFLLQTPPQIWIYAQQVYSMLLWLILRITE